MASIIPGYEYDIFISYRRKDNKSDRWVSEFVEALKAEIEATFKEDITIYFDENPQEGLLETHDVDASLKEKLKCLIFIPIISRTYCDPRSFAWDHEFKAFIGLASQDRLGLKVRLPNGYVASRILPVRIYDLDVNDIRLCESVLGGQMHSIEFVYKEPGVNRPLILDDDENKNQARTKYRNQINKTANAIKEIITGLKSEPVETVKDKVIPTEPAKEELSGGKMPGLLSGRIPVEISARKLWIPLLLILAAVCAFFVYKIISNPNSGKSIAILFDPRVKGDTAMMDICDIFTQNLQEKLLPVRKLTVRPRSSMLQYRGTGKTINEMSRDLKVDYFLYGSAGRSGNEITLRAELTSLTTNKTLWSGKYIWGTGMISGISSDMAQKIAQNLNVKLSTDEKRQINTDPTKNVQAEIDLIRADKLSYDAHMSLMMANKYLDYISYKSAIEAYDKAIEEDPLIPGAYTKRAIARAMGYYTRQLDSTSVTKCLDDIKRAEELNSDLPDLDIARGFYYYYCIRDLEKARDFFRTATEKDPGSDQALFLLAMVYRRMGDWEESFRLTRKLIALEPQEALTLTNIGLTYTYFHNYDSALLFHQKAIDNMPAWPSPYKNKIEALILKYGNTTEARAVLDTAVSKTGANMTDFKILLDIYDRKYSDAMREAEKYKPDKSHFEGEKYLYLADINGYLKNSTKAKTYYDSSLVSLNRDLEYDNGNFIIHSYIGLANAGLKNKNKAIEEGKKAVDLIVYDNFDKSDMILNLAKIYTMTGEFDNATYTIDYLLQTPMKMPSCFSRKMLELDPIWEPLFKWPEFKIMLKKISEN